MTPTLPTQQQMLFPLLEVLRENGKMRAKDAAAALADKLSIPESLRTVRVQCGAGQETNVLQRKIRWVRQNAVLAGLVLNAERGVWELAEKGNKALVQAAPGTLFCVARTDQGVILWGEAMTAMNLIEDDSAQLFFTSPPYPLVRQREYGGWHPDTWMETMLAHCDMIGNKLTSNGSLVLNLADVYKKGSPTLNTYQEELVVEMKRRGFNLIGKQSWFNPGKPRTTPYVTKDRTRLANGIETFFWWSPSERPKANNSNVLQPYSEGHLKTLAKGGELRRDRADGARQSSPGLRYRTDNGGSIPFNFVQCGHEGGRSAYVRHIHDHPGLKVHPARMPGTFPNFWIRFLTDAGDTVCDPFGGSLTTAGECEKLGRRYITSEKSLNYIEGGLSRLQTSEGLERPSYGCTNAMSQIAV